MTTNTKTRRRQTKLSLSADTLATFTILARGEGMEPSQFMARALAVLAGRFAQYRSILDEALANSTDLPTDPRDLAAGLDQLRGLAAQRNDLAWAVGPASLRTSVLLFRIRQVEQLVSANQHGANQRSAGA
jgi:hypothetical protein